MYIGGHGISRDDNWCPLPGVRNWVSIDEVCEECSYFRPEYHVPHFSFRDKECYFKWAWHKRVERAKENAPSPDAIPEDFEGADLSMDWPGLREEDPEFQEKYHTIEDYDPEEQKLKDELFWKAGHMENEGDSTEREEEEDEAKDKNKEKDNEEVDETHKSEEEEPSEDEEDNWDQGW